MILTTELFFFTPGRLGTVVPSTTPTTLLTYYLVQQYLHTTLLPVGKYCTGIRYLYCVRYTRPGMCVFRVLHLCYSTFETGRSTAPHSIPALYSTSTYYSYQLCRVQYECYVLQYYRMYSMYVLHQYYCTYSVIVTTRDQSKKNASQHHHDCIMIVTSNFKMSRGLMSF